MATEIESRAYGFLRALLLSSTLALGAPLLGPRSHSQADAQEGGTVVGSIHVLTVEGTRVFEVVEGTSADGFATGFNRIPRGESMALRVSLQGREEGTDATVVLRVLVAQSSGAHLCDPKNNTVDLYPAEEGSLRRRLRPEGDPSESCPPAPEGPGGLEVNLNVRSASFDPETGALALEGDFAGPLGDAEAAFRVLQGSFQATVHSFRSLSQKGRS